MLCLVLRTKLRRTPQEARTGFTECLHSDPQPTRDPCTVESFFVHGRPISEGPCIVEPFFVHEVRFGGRPARYIRHAWAPGP